MVERSGDSVETYKDQEMGVAPLSALKGKAILTINEGEKLGQVEDILIDRNTMQVAAIVMSQGVLLNKERKYLPAAEVATWGRDAVLVKTRSAFRPETDLPERESWISAGQKLKGLAIVSTSGNRVGQIDDLLVNPEGRIVAYRISEGIFGGRGRELSADTTKSIGADAVIVDMETVNPDVADIESTER